MRVFYNRAKWLYFKSCSYENGRIMKYYFLLFKNDGNRKNKHIESIAKANIEVIIAEKK
ncbi:hypothetical protein GF376_03490 [Candidatus Peregrinibacteria bacterium]|nr:hypothetical protein [Candidatus Peregrinibacteria bacterium]